MIEGVGKLDTQRSGHRRLACGKGEDRPVAIGPVELKSIFGEGPGQFFKGAAIRFSNGDYSKILVDRPVIVNDQNPSIEGVVHVTV